MSVKVSVIVPVYNVEKYLGKCLDSLVSQTLRDIEIIVVNDGSPDNSQDIIGKFAAAYPGKIVALKQKNQGLGAARNFGALHACGEYIGFVDSDDWARRDMFELLYNAAAKDNADVVICGYYSVNENNGESEAHNLYSADDEMVQTTSGFVQISTKPALAWNKLYRKRLVLDTLFPSTYYEDVATIPIILSNCEKISFLPEPLYYYLKRPGSITAQRNNPKNLDIIKAWERCLSEGNPKYIKEMEYAVYASVSFFLTFKKEHLDDFFVFFWKNEERFKHNEYIRERIRSGGLVDLFKFMDTSEGELSPYVQNLIDFMEDTTPLIEQLDSLSHATLAELYEMYGMAVQSATENTLKVGPKLLVQLTARFDRIAEKLKVDS